MPYALCAMLFITKRFDGVEQRSFPRWVESKEHPNGAREEKGQKDRLDREEGRPLSKAGEDHGPQYPDPDTHDPSHETED